MIFQGIDLSHATRVIFQAKDDLGVGLDCLKIVQRGRRDYLGVYHSLKDNRFELRLAQSRDLIHWKFVTTLEDHAHQGYLVRFGKEWLLASEKDGPNGNWIRIRVYADDQALFAAKTSLVHDISRTLAPNAEGTPNFLKIRKGKSWDDSEISIGFHFYRNSDVDRQAVGILKNFNDWTCQVRSTVNEELESKYLGNIGDREILNWHGQTLELLEAQLSKQDWSSWRILQRLGKGKFSELEIATPGHSKSFANPNGTALKLPDGKSGYVLTFFMPSQGNAANESGTVIYILAR